MIDKQPVSKLLLKTMGMTILCPESEQKMNRKHP